jgi:tetratricopeptide (TPR) repeat protein
MFTRRLLVVFPLLLVPCALAQFAQNMMDDSGNVRVQLIFNDGRRCHVQAHVVLMSAANNTPVGDSYTNDECMVTFDRLGVGDYHMVITGDGIAETDSGTIQVDSRKASQSIFVTIKHEGEDESGAKPTTGPSTVAAADLNVPDSAKREYAKAAAPFNKGDWNKAKEQILKALAIYPQYASAYNDLGVVYGRLGDRTHEREALQKAVSFNDHFAEAYINLGKMSIVDHNFPDAERFLDKAASSDPSNAQTLMLLGDVELMNKHFDEAIANCRKVHTMPHGSQTLVHYIAARALMHENRPDEALTELKTFLTEEPSGPRADAVRAEIGKLQHGNN